MKISINYRTFIFLVVLLMLGLCFSPLSLTHSINRNYIQSFRSDDVRILFAPMYTTTTYIIDTSGDVNHTWSSPYAPGVCVYMLDDNTILRTIRLAPFGAGAGGGIQKIKWDGTKLWEFTYYTTDHLSHHDIAPLPNGNVLMIAWESYTRVEAIEAGRDPNKLQGNIIKPDHIIEVEPTDPSNGEIVWEWHAWDHLIQDYDPTKDNYGVVEDHPELIDINFGSYGSDWLHTNSIDYNEEFDQILLSSHNFNEIWVIDHSTTTEEASCHTGGDSGKGGDILYRWGNPRAYGAGNSGDQKFFGQHDASWIKEGCPGEGNILVFNNGVSRPGGQYSSVDEIIPPIDDNGNYSFEPGSAFGPEEQIWIYKADNPYSFYSNYVGGAQRLPNGNTVICEGAKGKFFEVTADKEKIWEYTSPYPNYNLNDIFKIQYIVPDEEPPKKPDLSSEGSLSWKDVKPGVTLDGVFKIKNIGNSSSLLNWEIKSFPDWGNWTFEPLSGKNLTPEDGKITVEVSVEIPNEENTEFAGYIRVENSENQDDFEVIPVHINTPVNNNLLISFLYHIISFLWIKLCY